MTTLVHRNQYKWQRAGASSGLQPVLMKALCVLCCSAVRNSFTTENQRTQSKDIKAAIDAQFDDGLFIPRFNTNGGEPSFLYVYQILQR